MKNIYLTVWALLASVGASAADGIVIDGNEYPVDTLIERQVGPGTTYMRLRLPSYPLNVNMLRVDMNDPNVRVETTQANEVLFGTERLVAAAERQSSPGHRAVAGANGNFWCVSQSYPYSDFLVGTTFNANLRNGKILTETNCAANQWDRGPEYIGEIGITPDGRVFSDHFRWVGTVTSDAMGSQSIQGSNKLVHADEIVMFNSYYGTANTMKCADLVWRDGSNRWGYDLVHGVATEVYLRMVPGQKWSAGGDIAFEVVSVADDTDMGTVGDHDLVLVGRDSRREALRKLSAGDRVTLNYSWTTLDGTPIEFENMIGGNGTVMIDGELTELNTISENCALLYSKTGYGASADHKTLYIIVIDKSTDPVYGTSAGCTSAVMCQIARHYGCSNLTNFDSGGSAQMFVTDRIVNTTTESNPRAVANGMLVYATSPDDDVITRLEFADRTISVPTYAAIAPTILGYNKYGALISLDVEGVTFNADASIGTVNADATKFVAGSEAASGMLTASLGGVSVSKRIDVVEAPFAFAIPYMIVNLKPEPLMMQSVVGGETFTYRPENVEWTISDYTTEVAPVAIDADGSIVAVCEGTATVTARIGDRTAQAQVSAEFFTENSVWEYIEAGPVNPADWKITKSGTSTPVMTAGGTDGYDFDLEFNVTSARGPRVTVSKDIRLHATPLWITAHIESDQPLSGVTLTFLCANSNRTKSVPMERANSYYLAGYLGDLDEEGHIIDTDRAIYPITFKSLQFTPTNTGEHHIKVKDLMVANDIYLGTTDITVDAPDGPERWYNLSGIPVDHTRALAPGIYIRRHGHTATTVLIK